MHVNQKSIRKSQAKATMQAFKRHISHNKEQRVAQILTQGKTIPKSTWHSKIKQGYQSTE